MRIIEFIETRIGVDILQIYTFFFVIYLYLKYIKPNGALKHIYSTPS